MLSNQRDQFDIPGDVVYLNCASQSPLLNSVCRAGEEGVLRKAHPWTDFRSEAAANAERARGQFAQLIGATADDVAIVPATSYGISVAARNLPLTTGQRVVTLDNQFPSNFHAWRVSAEDAGADFHQVARPDDGDWTTAVLAAIDDNTTVVALPPCHWTDGSALDLATIGERCRAVGAAFVIDATQAAGAGPIDVARLQPDFLVSSAYKWLLCPYTLAFLYAAPHRQTGRPIEFHEWAVSGMENRASDRDPTATAIGARRYDMGERNNPINLMMATTALQQLIDWTPAGVAETIKSLTDRVATAARDRGFAVPPDAHRVAHYIGMRMPNGLPDRADERLAEKNIHISLRGDSLRVSPHIFNTAEDIDRLFAELDRIT